MGKEQSTNGTYTSGYPQTKIKMDQRPKGRAKTIKLLEENWWNINANTNSNFSLIAYLM